MSMDQRQQQIETGAGLTESRLNAEFVDFLRKYSSWFLVAILLVVGGYIGYRRLGESRDTKVREAFEQYEAAVKAGNPAGLLRVADDFEGQAGISMLARLNAADIKMTAAIAGVVPGAELDDKGGLKNADDALTAAKRDGMLDEAGTLFSAVRTATQGDAKRSVLTLRAIFGQAAVAESRAKWDEATNYYKAAGELAKTAELLVLAKIAQERIDSMGDVKVVPRLYSRGEIKTKPEPVAPPQFVAPVPEGPNFPPMPLLPDEAPAPAPAPAPALAPAPEPAPAPAPGN